MCGNSRQSKQLDWTDEETDWNQMGIHSGLTEYYLQQLSQTYNEIWKLVAANEMSFLKMKPSQRAGCI